MDKKTLRAIVVEYRKTKGWTFSKIAEMLKNDYGIIRDRQALHGIYTRAMKNIEEEKAKYCVADTADVVNIYALGYNMAETSHLVNNKGDNMSYYNVRDIVAKEAEYIKTVKNNMAFKAVSMVMEGKSQADIIAEFAYKGVPPTEKGTKAILIDAYTMIVTGAAMNELVKAYRDIDDREIIKEVIKRTGLNVDISEVKNRA